jgi:pyridoxamine 5'-phosphate oxidase
MEMKNLSLNAKTPKDGFRELLETNVDPDPFKQFETWLTDAIAAQLPQPLGMALATSTPDGKPSARMVLLRGFDESGFTFFTNYDSRKARELLGNPWAALVFYWAELERQVRVEGCVGRISAAESDEYFKTRPPGSQLGAWASPQSEIIRGREQLERKFEQLLAQYADGPIPRPENWGGYRLVPESIEFWQGRANRLHDRLRYRRLASGGWILQRLAP